MHITNMTKYLCDYCQKNFTTKSSLNRHQSRATYCRQARGLEPKEFICICNKRFTRNDNLRTHQTICSIFNKGLQTPVQKDDKHGSEELLLKVIEKYGEMVKDLQKQIAELSSKPATQTNNNTRNVLLGNLQPITDQDLQQHLDHLTLDFIQDGAKGYASFAGHYPLKDKVLCTDRSRKKLQYKDADGELTDNGRALAQRFFQAISERNTEILNRAYSDLHNELQDIVAEGRAGDADVTSILTQATKLQDILIKSQRVARGEDDAFAEEFLSHLTKIL